ncbi:MAG TPA: carbon monoxide dehydrogenase subunit G [Micromonosporaceae bacterium]|nr:carbon monoxide dehydrogenase subunit G [Micromonosporaceae bacterium]
MKVSGEATLHGPVDRVYAALNDPAVLVRTIPGCERLEQVGPDAYRMVVTAGVAAVKGTYLGEVALAEQDPPHAFVLTAAGSGTPGTVSAQARVRLAPSVDGTTLVSYDADAVVGGVVGGVGQRVLTSVARRTAGDFFAAVDAVLTGAEAAGGAEAVGGEAVGGAGAAAGGPEAGAQVAGVGGAGEWAQPPATAPLVFTRPPAAGPRWVLAPGGFAAGALFGAAAALLGAVVGAAIARRRG